jgi:ADP-ribose pyrophosphatase YjhB (NUDIX family)
MAAEQINFCQQCGTKMIISLRAGRERPVCPQCDWVFFPDPKVAVVTLVMQGTKVLLARRVNTPQQGLWTLPGGFVDAGEDPAHAAERECLEETGLTVQVTGLMDVIAGQEHPRGAHILIVYKAEIISGEINPGDDVDRVQFFDFHKLPPLAFHSTQKIINQIS